MAAVIGHVVILQFYAKGLRRRPEERKREEVCEGREPISEHHHTSEAFQRIVKVEIGTFVLHPAAS